MSTAESRQARFLTAGDIAAELQISRAKAYRIMRDMLHVKIDGLLRVPRAAFEVYLQERERIGWQSDSTSGARRGGAGTTNQAEIASHARPSVAIKKPRKQSCVNGNALLLIRPTLPRTKPRSVTPSDDSLPTE
jgi:hypothetical protein